MKRFKQYPARTQAFIAAVVLALTAFGVGWNEMEVAALLGVSQTGIALFLEGLPKRNTDV